jgi:hypothetical protein
MPHLSTFEHMPPSGFCWLFVRWNQASEREGAFASTLGYSSTRVPSVITADQMQQRIANVQWYDSTHFPKCGASRKRRRNWGLAVTCLTEFALDTLHTERQFADHSSPFASGCFVAATTAFAGAVTLKCWQRFESLLPRLWPCPRPTSCGSPCSAAGSVAGSAADPTAAFSAAAAFSPAAAAAAALAVAMIMLGLGTLLPDPEIHRVGP